MEPTEFEHKVLEAIGACRDYGDFYELQFIEMLREIMPPTCTTTERTFLDTFIELDKKGLPQFCDKNERMFLDEIREKGLWVDEEEGKGIELPQESFLSQDDFKTPLNELIK